MNFGKAFTFVFEDPDWIKKVLIIALVSLIPLLGQIVLIGWMLQTSRNVLNRHPYPLPELDFGSQLSLGFKGFVASLVYAIPVIILSIPYTIIMSSAGTSNNGDMNTVGIISVLCFTTFAMIYSLLLAFVVPAAYGNIAAKDSIGAGLNFKEVFGLVRATPVSYLIILGGSLVGSFVGSLGTIACGIGVFATAAYAQAMIGHLVGQAYQQAVEKQSPIPQPAPYQVQ